MAAPDRGADQTLHVVMNYRVIGNVQRTGKRSMRLRYDEPDLRIFTPLSISMRDPGRGYREAIVSPWLEGLLPDRPETVRQGRRQFGVAADDSPFSLLRHVGEDVAGAAQFVRTDRLQAVLHDPGQIEPLDTAQRMGVPIRLGPLNPHRQAGHPGNGGPGSGRGGHHANSGGVAPHDRSLCCCRVR